MNIYSKYKFAKSSDLKLRIVANSINKKLSAEKNMHILSLSNKKSSFLINKALKSAIFNAINNYNININDLFIEKILINKGPYIKKVFPRAKGRVNYIKKRTSHIIIKLNIKKKDGTKS
ncbi:50S ribosomal protein L22 [endosymbiont of Euscepes postfasciatus]|uniref:50S ribosomal protein L22 n=1 Tax=endosymbiont of Euscepes postfasciatus TaxID=650377 RepID=UPI000DC6E8CB|nr:50S ribosomal protein L22 [endosymbiont of Euscepes postfasciatus]BBA84688.1 50S ribosomal protein L22 [endosymbiont of Euscepes postfasciatus]